MNVSDTLINACVESASQPPLVTPEFEILSQFHVLIAMPFSTGKSLVAKSIPNAKICLNYTLPSMVGTIDKNGNIINSALKESAKGVFIIDEAHRLSSSSVDALLSLLEQGYYKRDLGYKVNGSLNITGDIEKDGYVLEPSENGFKIKVRFACIWFGERIYKFHEKAFLSRFFPLIIKPSRTDLEDFMMGKSFLYYKPLKLKFKQFKRKTTINKSNFELITRKLLKFLEIIIFQMRIWVI